MEMAQVGLRTRARAALAMGAPSSSPARSPKRRKINNNNNTKQGLKFSASSFVQLKTMSSGAVVLRPETVSLLPDPEEEERCSSAFSDESSPASCCSSNGAFGLDEERIKFLDLEVESAQVETSKCNCRDDIREMKMSLSSELRTNSQEVESVEKNPTQANSRCVVVSTPQKMPTELELEEFFAAAEIDIQKRFSDKYNYDIVRDVPMEGRYEWVQLKP